MRSVQIGLCVFLILPPLWTIAFALVKRAAHCHPHPPLLVIPLPTLANPMVVIVRTDIA